MNKKAQGRIVVTVNRLFRVRPVRSFLHLDFDLLSAVAQLTLFANDEPLHTETFSGKVGTLEYPVPYLRAIQFDLPDKPLTPESMEFRGRCPDGIFEYDVRMEKPV